MTPRRRTAKGEEPSLLGRALKEATWAEADRSLAEAFRDADAVVAAMAAARRARSPAARAERLAEAEAAALLARQSLASAARMRALSLSGARGAEVVFDARLHATHAPPAAGARVRILAPAVVRAGPNGESHVVVRAEARALRRRERVGA